MLILPAILENDIDTFSHLLKRLSPHFTKFQIDIADGELVPNKTLPIEDVAQILNNQQSAISNKSFDFHLMVADYDSTLQHIDSLKNIISIATVFIHIKAISKPLDVKKYDFNVGLVLNPEDSIKDNLNELLNCSWVQIMTVTPGFQGAPFLPDQLQKIDELQKNLYTGKIILDGGINNYTIPTIIKRRCRPDALAIGSYLTKTHDLKARLEEIQKAIPDAEF